MSRVKEIGKKTISLILVIVIANMMSSCGDLTEDTSGVLEPGTFYETERDFEAAVMPMYRYISKSFRNAQGQMIMFAGDDMTARPGGNKAPFRGYDLFNYSADANWLHDWTYEPYWKTIIAANAIIENIEEASLEQSFRDEIAGQAHFMRGLSYYMLVRLYGGVPLITSTETTGEETRATVLEVYNLIESDLEFAESALPMEWNDAAGKATSGAAKTVLASVYLTSAGWPLKDESKYEMAASKAKEVIDSGRYDLVPDFEDLWLTENDNNIESVFSIQFSRESGVETSLARSWASFEEGGYVDGMAELGLFKRMPEGPRKEATYQTVFTRPSDGTTVDWEDSQFSHPTFKKWIVGGELVNEVYQSGQSIPLFRYAQVLLIFAEAQNMDNGGPDQQAYAAINQVRDRAGLSDLPSGLSQAEFREAVIRERSWEFAGEYTRWFDMVRTETVEEATMQRDPADLELFQVPTKEHYISPIPDSEINRNPNLVQNPEGNIIR